MLKRKSYDYVLVVHEGKSLVPCDGVLERNKCLFDRYIPFDDERVGKYSFDKKLGKEVLTELKNIRCEIFKKI